MLEYMSRCSFFNLHPTPSERGVGFDIGRLDFREAKENKAPNVAH